MLKRIKQLPGYFSGLIITLVFAAIFTTSFSKTQGFLILNQYHSLPLDKAFNLLTNLGDGLLTILIIFILLALRKRKKAITILLAYTYLGIIVQLAKKLFNLPRPRYQLEQLNINYTNFVSGVTLHDHYSFPSGHTASAFALATALVLIFKKSKISFICLSAAVIAGYSRIYLAQHFPIDVIVGALTGVACAMMSYHQVYVFKLFRQAKLTKRFKRVRVAVKEVEAT